ncbi:MAG: hypothetical protein E4G96_09165 [Chrysiogenales bacterium]|nr:MAG: hypothetical protein E4G96_09165 [Chrysiogenales bacterium]
MKPSKRMIGIIGSTAEGIYFVWGILFAGWSPMLAAFGYWIEEAVVFLVTLAALFIMRIWSGKRMFIPRFAFIYGFMFFIHTIFFTILAGYMGKSDPAAEKIFEVFFWLFLRGNFHYPYGIMTDLVIITAVVTASCLYTVILRIRRAGPDPSVIINRSLGAVISSHFLLLFGIGGIMLADAPSALVVVLIVVKILIDLSGFSNRGSAVVTVEES